MHEQEQDSEVDVNEDSRAKRRKTRRELLREEQRINKLIQIHTSDMKFFKPAADETTLSFGGRHGELCGEGINDGYQDDSVMKYAKFLLVRQRNQERTLRKSAFEREKKGFDEYLFEANSSQHRQNILQEQEAL